MILEHRCSTCGQSWSGMTHICDAKYTADRAAVVDPNYFWRPIDANTPRGAKLQLINKRLGVAVYGTYHGGSEWTHWAPLPKFAE